jgi:hypothetical protein
MATDNIPNSWIQYDFKDSQVSMRHYSLRSRNDVDSHHLINWVVEGSADGSHWVELDRRSNCRDLAGLNRIATYQISVPGFFRMIRLRQFQKNSFHADYLLVSAFELFGVLARFP